MTHINLDRLERIAQAATQGSWRFWNPSDGTSHISIDNQVAWESKRAAAEYGDDEPIPHWADAQHIAAFDPPTVLALIARIRDLEATIQRVRDARSNHPEIPECDRYTDDDTIKCGWKSAIESIDKALEGEPK